MNRIAPKATARDALSRSTAARPIACAAMVPITSA
jgi:hypothetical protein